MKRMVLVAALAAYALSGCQGDTEAPEGAEAATGIAVVATEGATNATAVEAAEPVEGVVVRSATVAVAPSYIEGQGPEWSIQIGGDNVGEAFDGLEYRVELLDAKGELFATHGSQMWFTPGIDAGAPVSWGARIPVQAGQPDAEGVSARVTIVKRLTKEALTEGAWKPLDPNNLPPAREVKLDKDGNVVG